MANSDKNILITPNRGSTTDNPRIDFVGADSSTAGRTISLNVLPISNGTLSFEGSAGQLFSITNELTGTIFSVNDVSGIPSIEVNADGTVSFAEFFGNVGVGTASPSDKFTVNGSIRIIANSSSYRQNNTATWSGNPGSGEGKIEYHSNRWYYVSGSNSTEIARWRQSGTDRAWLTNAGAFNAANEITAFASDGRLKENIKNIESPLEKLNKINGVTYDWKLDDCAKWDFEPANKSDIGFIAQEIQAILPNAVAPAPFDVDENGNSRSGENYLTIKPEKVIPLLVEAVKAQQQQIDELKALVQKLIDK